MRNNAHILILLLLLLVIPSSSVFACGASSSDKEKTERASCSKEESHSEKMACCNTGEKGDDGCNGNCEHTYCHCPITVKVPFFINYVGLSNTTNFSLLVNDWAYVPQNPKAVYFSIWQPPKIG